MKSQLKSKLREIVSWGYYFSRHFLSRLKGKVLILTYHRVLSEKELNEGFVQPGMYVRDDAFEIQMEFLREHFEVVPSYRDQATVNSTGRDKHPESSATHGSQFHRRRYAVRPNLRQGHYNFRPAHSGAAELPGAGAPLVLKDGEQVTIAAHAGDD